MADAWNLIAHATNSTSNPYAAGNQNGLEIHFRQFYAALSSGGWGYVYRFKPKYNELASSYGNQNYADKMAQYQSETVLNGHVGYESAITPLDSYKGAIRVTMANQVGFDVDRYIKSGYRSTDKDGRIFYWSSVNPQKFENIIDRECSTNCTALTYGSFLRLTGFWYHYIWNTKWFDRAPNPNIVVPASQPGHFHDVFNYVCRGGWTRLTHAEGSGYRYWYDSLEKASYLPVDENDESLLKYPLTVKDEKEVNFGNETEPKRRILAEDYYKNYIWFNNKNVPYSARIVYLLKEDDTEISPTKNGDNFTTNYLISNTDISKLKTIKVDEKTEELIDSDSDGGTLGYLANIKTETQIADFFYNIPVRSLNTSSEYYTYDYSEKYSINGKNDSVKPIFISYEDKEGNTKYKRAELYATTPLGKKYIYLRKVKNSLKETRPTSYATTSAIYFVDQAGKSVLTPSGLGIFTTLYQFYVEPFMDEYIVADDNKSLLKVEFDKDNNFMGYRFTKDTCEPLYENKYGEFSWRKFNVCKHWDSNSLYVLNANKNKLNVLDEIRYLNIDGLWTPETFDINDFKANYTRNDGRYSLVDGFYPDSENEGEYIFELTTKNRLKKQKFSSNSLIDNISISEALEEEENGYIDDDIESEDSQTTTINPDDEDDNGDNDVEKNYDTITDDDDSEDGYGFTNSGAFNKSTTKYIVYKKGYAKIGFNEEYPDNYNNYYRAYITVWNKDRTKSRTVYYITNKKSHKLMFGKSVFASVLNGKGKTQYATQNPEDKKYHLVKFSKDEIEEKWGKNINPLKDYGNDEDGYVDVVFPFFKVEEYEINEEEKSVKLPTKRVNGEDADFEDFYFPLNSNKQIDFKGNGSISSLKVHSSGTYYEVWEKYDESEDGNVQMYDDYSENGSSAKKYKLQRYIKENIKEDGTFNFYKVDESKVVNGTISTANLIKLDNDAIKSLNIDFFIDEDRHNILKSPSYLKRGDILNTRNFCDGKIQGGHAACYV